MDQGRTLLVNLTRGTVVCERLVIADKPLPRMRGLLGRRQQPEDEGMLFLPAPSIHTAFMRFSIDAAFLDSTMRVKRVVENLHPWRLKSVRGSRSVLELAAGQIRQRGLSEGDQVAVVDISDHVGAVIAAADPDRAKQWSAEPVLQIHEAPPRETAPCRSGDEPCVLIFGDDRRFRSVAAALLARRGCAISLGGRQTDLEDLPLSHFDVVVLDLSTQVAQEAAARIAALEPTSGRPGVVLVDEDPALHLPRLSSSQPVLKKWGSFNDLFEAVVAARGSVSRKAISYGPLG